MAPKRCAGRSDCSRSTRRTTPTRCCWATLTPCPATSRPPARRGPKPLAAATPRLAGAWNAAEPRSLFQHLAARDRLPLFDFYLQVLAHRELRIDQAHGVIARCQADRALRRV